MHIHGHLAIGPGKLKGWPPLNTLVTGKNDQLLLCVRNRSSGRRFLINTGAEVSVIPASARDLRYRKRGQPSTAANGSTIEAYDFLRAHLLLIDLQRRRLINSNTYASVSQTSAQVALCITTVSQTKNEFSNLLASRPSFTTPTFSKLTARNGVTHNLPPPVHSRAHCLSPDKLAIAKAEFDNMEALGIVHRSSSTCSAPLQVAPKPNGGW
uniref:Peptidase A2 domain-containing protein n=1 Tax=Octopus bimaculoides TaxID=37653 RepID=A0A0L8GPR2_OCTBM